MRLLVYAHRFAPDIGGAETLVRLLAEGLAASAEVTLITNTRTSDSREQASPFRVLRAPSVRAMWREVRRADVVHIAGPALLPMLLCVLARRRFVVEHHGYQAICPNGLLWRHPARVSCTGYFMQGNYAACARCVSSGAGRAVGWRSVALMWVRRALVRCAAEQVAVSSHVARRLRPIPARVILHGVRPAAATPLRDSDRVRFVYVGRLVEEKGVELLIDAAAMLARESQQFEVVLVGDGPERQRLEQHALTRGSADLVRFAGECIGERLEEEFAGASVIVLPSRWEETAGLVILEAAARGRTAIVAEIGGAREYGTLVGAILFEAGNVESLAAVMRALCSEPARISAITTATRALPASDGEAARMVQDHLTLYREVVAR